MRNTDANRGGMRRAAAVAALLGAALLPGVAGAQQTETDPRLVPVAKEHCLALYDLVELRLKDKGDQVVSITTRNGLKDFFVVRPGVADCTGEREIPWRDDRDREFIRSLLQDAGGSLNPKADLAASYAIGPAPRATVPRL